MAAPVGDIEPPRRVASGRRIVRWSVGLACLAGSAAAIWFVGPRFSPVPAELLAPVAEPALIVDRHGQPLRHPLDPESGTRRAASTTSVPEPLVQCVIAAEDKRFFSHGGTDTLAMVRAMGQWASRGRAVSGASTLTQQVVKLRLHRDQPRTAVRKLREAWFARALEHHQDKHTILRTWLDEVDFGNLNRGITQAARDYFGKAPADLSLAECATLAGLPQAPSRLNPRRYPERATTRRNVVLDRLAAIGSIPADAIAAAHREPLVVHQARSAFLAPHFADLLAATPGGGVVRTTLDQNLQAFAGARLMHHLDRLSGRNVSQGAALVLDNASGGVLAMVGSSDFATGPAGQVNHALARRSPGSTLKPFTYVLAFEEGFGPWSVLPDVPSAFPSTTGPYRPENYDRDFRGPVTARAALANSLNIPAVRLLDDCGGASALASMLRRVGFSPLDSPPERYGLGLTIGNAETTLWDLAVAYGTLARQGTLMVPTMRLDAPPMPPRVVADPVAVWMVTDILRDNQARSGGFSLDSALRFPFPVAAKTGTSTDFRDNWTIGYTPEFTVAVWVGNSDNSPMRKVSGVDGAAPVFHDLMARLHRDREPIWPPPPPGVIAVSIDPLTGCRVPASHRRAVREFARAEKLPPPQGPSTESTDGRAILSPDFDAWLGSVWNRYPHRFSRRQGTDIASPPRILFPTPGTTVMLDPSLPDSGRRLTLECDLDGRAPVRWSSPTLPIENGPDGRARAVLEPGRHELTATRPDTKSTARTWVEVKEK